MSTQKQVAEFYLTTRQLSRLLILAAFISGGVCQTIVITCPTAFEDGEWGNVTCSVNNTAASSCSPTIVQFSFKSASGIVKRLCESTYGGACGQAGRVNCSCVGFQADIYTYQLSIWGNRTEYGGGTLVCNIDCLPTSSFTGSCPATYETSTTTPGTTELTSNPVSTSVTRESTPASTPSINVTAVYKQGNSTCDDICIGLAAGVTSSVVFLAVLTAILIILMKIGVIRSPERCCKEAKNTSRQSQENNAETNTMSKQGNRTNNQPASNTKESKVTAPNKNRPTK